MIEVVEFTVSYEAVSRIKSLSIIIEFAYAECLTILSWIASTTSKNITLPNPEERLSISSPHIYLQHLRIIFQKHPLASRDPK